MQNVTSTKYTFTGWPLPFFGYIKTNKLHFENTKPLSKVINLKNQKSETSNNSLVSFWKTNVLDLLHDDGC